VDEVQGEIDLAIDSQQAKQLTLLQFLMDYTEGSLFTILILALVTGSKYTPAQVPPSPLQPPGPTNHHLDIKSAPVPFFLKPITNGVAGKIDSGFVDPELKTHFDFLEDYLVNSPSKGEFFCSDKLTAADIMIHFGLEGATQVSSGCTKCM